MVRGGTVVTPVADCILAGITRETVLHLARTLGYAVEEQQVTAEQLGDADEVFLTGTAYEITPVRSIGDTSYRVGAVTRALIGAYQQLVRPRRVDGTSRSQAQGGLQAKAPASGVVRLNGRSGEPTKTELGA
jgi:hypothetical protein